MRVPIVFIIAAPLAFPATISASAISASAAARHSIFPPNVRSQTLAEGRIDAIGRIASVTNPSAYAGEFVNRRFIAPSNGAERRFASSWEGKLMVKTPDATGDPVPLWNGRAYGNQ
jgi:hypothetical protein